MFDPTKPVKNREGYEAKILYILNNTYSDYPILAIYTIDGIDYFNTYTRNGYCDSTERENKVDLINIEPHEKIEKLLPHASSSGDIYTLVALLMEKLNQVIEEVNILKEQK